jgi:hypothetical protein
MMPTRRRWLLGLGLAATALLAWFAPEGEEAAGAPAARARRAAAMAQTPAQVPAGTPPAAAAVPSGPLALAPRDLPAGEIPDLFRSFSWYVPPPPPPPPPPASPPPPPVPTAPPLPFSFMGQLVENEQPQIMLVRDERLLTVRVGEAIDRNYRLESFKDRVLTFVYLPLDTRQTLNTGSTQ